MSGLYCLGYTDSPGIFQGVPNLWNPCVRVSQNTRVILVVSRLSRDYQPPWHPLCQSIQARCSYTGSAGIIPGLPTPWYPCMIVFQSTAILPDNPVSEYPTMPKLHRQSQDYPETSKHPGTPVSEYPGVIPAVTGLTLPPSTCIYDVATLCSLCWIINGTQCRQVKLQM